MIHPIGEDVYDGLGLVRTREEPSPLFFFRFYTQVAEESQRIRHRMSGEGRPGKRWIATVIVADAVRVSVRQIAAAVARNEDLPAQAIIAFEQAHGSATFGRTDSGPDPGGASSNHNCFPVAQDDGSPQGRE